MTDKDALTALRERAEGMGIEIVIFLNDQLEEWGNLGMWFILWADHIPVAEFPQTNLGIQAAHALLDWWERRDWVFCPGESGFICVRGLQFDVNNHLRGRCERCHGIGRVPKEESNEPK